MNEVRPPLMVSGGKRLNFDREDPYTFKAGDTFLGTGKCEGTTPSASWDELCAFATLIVEHPAYKPVRNLSDAPQQPYIEDER